VQSGVYDVFADKLAAAVKKLKPAPGVDAGATQGPLIDDRAVEKVEQHISDATSKGARVLVGGKRHALGGRFFEPTVLTDVTPDSPAYHDEVFGPVAILFRARDLDDAIRLANDTPFGLGASAWTTDPAERSRFVAELESGMVFINAMVASDPRVPFGGVKQSGYGRELSSQGIREFVNIKTVWIQESAPAAHKLSESE
jgi:succinate-semialdehyde dehydrogenase/glutarate-semialdehyde dehydrogenase